MGDKLDFLHPQTTSGPEKLREQLQVLEAELPLLENQSREAVTAYLLTMDAAARILGQLQAGSGDGDNIVPEALRFSTVQQVLLKKAGKLHALLGRASGLKAIRPADATEQTRPWWFLDQVVARAQARRRRQIRIIAGVALAALVALWVLFNTVLKPDPNLVMRSERYQNALDDAMQSQDYAAALAEVEQILAVYPQDGEALTLKGELLELLNRPAEAESAFAQAQAIMAEPEAFWLERGRLLWQFGLNEQAMTQTQKAVTLKPDYAEAWLIMGQIYTSLDQRPQAYDALGKAADLAMAQDNLTLYTVAKMNLGQLMQSPQDLIPPEPTVEATMTP